MLENLGFSEILLIAIIMLVFFGPKKLPDIARSLGKGMSEFRRAMREVRDDITSEIKDKKSETDRNPRHHD